MLTRLDPLKHKPIHQLASKPNPHPTPNNTIRGLILRDEIVKGPTQMRQRIVNSNTSNRKMLGGTPSLGRGPSPCLPLRHHETISSRGARHSERSDAGPGGALASLRPNASEASR